MNDFPWLTLLIVAPLVGAVIVAFLPKGSTQVAPDRARDVADHRWRSPSVVAAQFDTGDGGLQLTETHEWISAFGVHYALGVDGLGLLLMLLTVVLVPLVMLASWNDIDPDKAKAFFAWALALEALSLAVFAATDVFLFYVVFEATLVPAYFLVGGFGREGRGKAALKFLMFQLGGGLVMLGSVIGLYVVSAQEGSPSYLLTDLQQLDFSTEAGRWLFAGFFIAFAVKAPLFPLHTWLADTTEHATPPTSVLLVCILDKIGTFGMLRFCLGLFPEASEWATPLVIVLALISIVYGAFVAIGQDDILRLIGLTSLSHFGFITLGHLRVHRAGRHRLDPLHGQPRHRDRGAVLRGRVHHQAPRHDADQPDGRAREGRPGPGRALPGRRARDPRPARPQPVRLRDPGADRGLRLRLVRRRDRGHQHRAGRGLRAVGLPADDDRPEPAGPPGGRGRGRVR